mgnify:CR=1 FL=1
MSKRSDRRRRYHLAIIDVALENIGKVGGAISARLGGVPLRVNGKVIPPGCRVTLNSGDTAFTIDEYDTWREIRNAELGATLGYLSVKQNKPDPETYLNTTMKYHPDPEDQAVMRRAFERAREITFRVGPVEHVPDED